MNPNLTCEIKILDKLLYEEHGLPKYETEGSCAIDLRSAQGAVLAANESLMLSTGLYVHIGSAYGNGGGPKIDDMAFGAVVLPRSGLGSRKGLVLGNLVGLIDEDYQGEITVCLWNRSPNSQSVQRGERIAQLAFMPFFKPRLKLVEEFSIETSRGTKGFGSTGRV